MSSEERATALSAITFDWEFGGGGDDYHVARCGCGRWEGELNGVTLLGLVEAASHHLSSADHLPLIAAGAPIVAVDGQPGCPEMLGVGAYRIRCGHGDAGVCDRHGVWAVPL